MLGAGLSIAGQGAQIEDCVIEENQGAGVSIWRDPDTTTATLRRVLVRDNKGSGVTTTQVARRVPQARVDIRRCESTGTGRDGFRLASDGRSRLVLSTAAGNGAAGVPDARGATDNIFLALRWCLISGNDTGVHALQSGAFRTTSCNVWDNRIDRYRAPAGEGHLSLDPILIDPERGDHRLHPDSPLVDAGDPDLIDPDGTRADIGAWPSDQRLEIALFATPDTRRAFTGQTTSVTRRIFERAGFARETTLHATLHLPEGGALRPAPRPLELAPLEQIVLRDSLQIPFDAPPGDYRYRTWLPTLASDSTAVLLE